MNFLDDSDLDKYETIKESSSGEIEPRGVGEGVHRHAREIINFMEP